MEGVVNLNAEQKYTNFKMGRNIMLFSYISSNFVNVALKVFEKLNELCVKMKKKNPLQHNI